jgi:phospholipase/carboxylesterase
MTVHQHIDLPDGICLDCDGATASIIWLHGLGADGGDFVPIVPELRLPSTLAVRFWFPDANVVPVTVNNGYRMRAWYDIKSLSLDDRADAPGLHASVNRVSGMIDNEIRNGIAPERIIVAGFSQGGVVALHTALTIPHRIGGAIALSTYLPHTTTLDLARVTTHTDLPILQCHGKNDNVVSYSTGRAAYAWLCSHGYQPEWHDYPMEHSLCALEITDIGRWLSARLVTSTPS